jgi:hypothetical protein
MNKKKATLILKNQIDKLESKENLNHRWTIETRTYLSTFFGQESEQYKHLDNFHWQPGVADDPERFKPHIVSFINDCISTINNIGLKKDPVDNWFSKLPNWAINLGLPALCFISFSVGILFTNNNNSELRKENSELKEQLLLISSDTITNKHKNLSDKPN